MTNENLILLLMFIIMIALVLIWSFMTFARAQIAVPIAILPDLSQCQGTHFKGNPDIIEYKCPATAYTPK